MALLSEEAVGFVLHRLRFAPQCGGNHRPVERVAKSRASNINPPLHKIRSWMPRLCSKAWYLGHPSQNNIFKSRHAQLFALE